MPLYNPRNKRLDKLPRPWNLHIQDGYEELSGLYTIAGELIKVSVMPLPDPSVPGNDEWHVSMNISRYEFAETWAAYLDILRTHGTIRHSEFEYLPLPEDEQPAPPRPQCAVTIDVELPPEEWGTQLFFMVTLYATGRVECMVRDEERYRELAN